MDINECIEYIKRGFMFLMLTLKNYVIMVVVAVSTQAGTIQRGSGVKHCK